MAGVLIFLTVVAKEQIFLILMRSNVSIFFLTFDVLRNTAYPKVVKVFMFVCFIYSNFVVLTFMFRPIPDFEQRTGFI